MTDHPVRDLGLLRRLTAESLEEATGYAVPRKIGIEVNVATEATASSTDIQKLGPPSRYACPECHGVLFEIKEGARTRFRCHTGHAFTLEAMRSAAFDAWEKALYEAMRAQQEQALIMQTMAANARDRGRSAWADTLENRERSYREGVEIIRQLLGGTADEGSGELD